LLRVPKTLEIEYTGFDSEGCPIRATIKEDGAVSNVEGTPAFVDQMVVEARARHLAGLPS
jgi:hypothetical protein